MKKRAPRAGAKAGVLRSPLPMSSPKRFSKKPSKSFDFDLTFRATSSKKTLSSSPLVRSPASPIPKTPANISDLKDLANSRANALKRHLDLCHSEVFKEINTSESRISKRFKMQAQSCTQLIAEAEEEHKKLSERIVENMDLLKASYVEFLAEAQATATRVCKEKIPELAQSVEKAIDSLRSRCRIPASPIQ
ncbi:Apolipoprotein [Dioscorea alata]|uniref:Apolipoprotein n=1 Tax=Dioscorea alata TaxID=55571 RepID=A0ACB7UFH9_DIOAL|nr:Apolipoprotein [Dioscorea alata]